MFAYEVLEKLRKGIVTINNQTKMNHLWLLLTYNNVSIPKGFVIGLKDCVSSKMYSYMMNLLNSRSIPLNFSNANEAGRFFQIAYSLGFVCSNRLKEYIACRLTGHCADRFFLGLRAYYNLVFDKNGQFPEGLNPKAAYEYFYCEINRRMLSKPKKESGKPISKMKKVIGKRGFHEHVKITEEQRKRNGEGYSYFNPINKNALRHHSRSQWVKIIPTAMGGSNKRY